MFFLFAARCGHLSPGIEEGIVADTFPHVCVIFLAHAYSAPIYLGSKTA